MHHGFIDTQSSDTRVVDEFGWVSTRTELSVFTTENQLACEEGLFK